MSGHILVVDDEPAMRDVLVTWLQAAGHRCVEARDAESALASARAHGFDAALLDLALPGQDGVWLAERLREQSADLALVLVTSPQRLDAAVAGLRPGVVDHLLKPFTRQDLVRAVRRAIEWRSSLLDDRARQAALQREVAGRRDALAGEFAALSRATTGAIQTLLATLHQRNPGAAAHASRVARMAVDLALALGVSPAEMGDIERGALLHDIGKMALPDVLVHKPGPYSEEEFAIIRTHVELGRDLVGVVPALRPAAAIVGASHEAFDGSGYPAGLSGRDIPLGARIVSVVDTFDALTFGRDTANPLTFARAAAELVRCAGTRYDPAVVHAWLRVADPIANADAVERLALDRLSSAGAS